MVVDSSPTTAGTRQRHLTRSAEPGTCTARSTTTTEQSPDPPPTYTEHRDGLPGTSNHPTPQAWDTRERRKPSWDLIGAIEERYWALSTANNVWLRWSLEIFSWGVSAVCMVVIVILLLVTHDKRQPSWPVSSYVSVISRLATSALLLPTTEAIGQLKWNFFRSESGRKRKMWDFETFDAASRGPVGSLMLLLRLKGGNLAALGAAIVLLAVGLDPFFQQVVSNAERSIHRQQSQLPRTVRYEPEKGTVIYNLKPAFVAPRDMMNTAEMFWWDNGTQPIPFGNVTRPDIPMSCPTSKCDWPIYDSLAVCSSCADISQYLTYACLDTRIDWFANASPPAYASTYPNATACGFWLNATSDNPVLMSGSATDPRSKIEQALTTRLFPLVGFPLRESYYGGSINFKDVNDPIMDFLVVSAHGGTNGVYANSTPLALECSLSWCLNTYRSSYNDNTYVEEIVSTYRSPRTRTYPWSVKGNVSVYSTTYNGDVNITNPGDGRDYGISNETAIKLQSVWDELFPGYVTSANRSSEEFLRYLNSGSGPLTRQLHFNPWAASNNVFLHVQRLANALTNVIRSTSDNAEIVVGNAYDVETYVRVAWAWLSLPLLVLLLSLAFLVATVCKSAEEKGQVFKNSAVATLLHALPKDVQQQANLANANPHAIANEVTIRLVPDAGTWRMSVAMPPSNPIFSPRL